MKVTFCLKGCSMGNAYLPLNIINSIWEYLRSMFILRFLISFNFPVNLRGPKVVLGATIHNVFYVLAFITVTPFNFIFVFT